MRLVVSVLIAVLTSWGSHAELLSFDEILENIEGRWGISYDALDDANITRRCDKAPLIISLQQDDSFLIYESQDLGSEYVSRSNVRASVRPDGGFAPFLLLQYEGEDRLTETGEPVQWRLLMTDPDTFYWQRTDMSFDALSHPRVRCQTMAAGS